MSLPSEQEIEVKFFVNDLRLVERRLKKEGAELIQPRVYEANWRYDTTHGDLSRDRRVLRVRQDTRAVITYKGPAQARSDVAARQEIEFEVSDQIAARHLLEALGYSVFLVYEKYRIIYTLNGLHVTLDEMPYGRFAEIEGPDADSIRATAEQLGLDWEARILDSYLTLFGRLKQSLKLEMRDLTFENFRGVTVAPADLGVRPAVE